MTMKKLAHDGGDDDDHYQGYCYGYVDKGHTMTTPTCRLRMNHLQEVVPGG